MGVIVGPLIESTYHINGVNKFYKSIDINEDKGKKICTYCIDYVISEDNSYIYNINSYNIMHTNDNYEVSGVATCGDIEVNDSLIQGTLNIYKKPHIGWNYRLICNIRISILKDGKIKYECN